MASQPGPADLWRLLDLAEDVLEAGYARPHAPPPQLREPVAQRPGAPAPAPGPAAARADSLEQIAAEVEACTACPLHKGRTRAVPGEGAPHPLLLVIGEGPGAEEDRTGRPFVGPAGQYLDEWLTAVKVGPGEQPLDRNGNTFIANVVKCRPPGNRDPQPDEAAACLGYLRRQVALLKPRAILAVGRTAARYALGVESGVGAARGRDYGFDGIPAVVTYHPSAVLRDRALRRPVWDDLKRLRALLGNE
jgi:uracil-DNA glycosylase